MEFDDTKIGDRALEDYNKGEVVPESSNIKITRKEWIQIIFNILLAITIATLIFTTITLIKNAEEIRNDPIDYAIKHSNINSCTCYNNQGQIKNYGLEEASETSFIGEIGDTKLVKEK